MQKQVWDNSLPSRAEQRQLKRDVLIRKAAAAFRLKGFHGTSMADMARALGVTKAALYRYISTKEELLYILHCHAMDAGDAALDLALRDGGNGLERLQIAVCHFVEIYADSDTASAAMTDIDALQSEQRREILRRRDKFDRTLRSFIVEGIDDGSIAQCDPKMAVFAIMGSVNWISRWFKPGAGWSSADVAKGLVDIFTLGMQVRPGRRSSMARKKS